MSLTEACINRPILAWVVLLTIATTGAVALSRLGLTNKPEYEPPSFMVLASLPGASPRHLEESVVTVIEDAVAGIAGVDHVLSSATQDSAWVEVKLRGKRNLDAVVNEAQQRLAALAGRFPRHMKPPTVEKAESTEHATLYLVLEGALGARRMSDLADTVVRPGLQSVPGVASVQIWGAPKRLVRLWLDPQRLAMVGLTAQDVRRALAREHVPTGGGSVENERGIVTMNVATDVRQVEHLATLPVAWPASSRPAISLREVAMVEDGFEDATFRVRFNGQPAAMVAVARQPGTNAVALAHAVETAVQRINQDLPKGVRLRISIDNTEHTRRAVYELGFELMLAIVVTGVCCRLFLGAWQSTLNVFLAIPVSLLGACAALYACDFTLNWATMLGLTIAVGIVVDDAIMVLESIDRAHQEGLDARTAALRGTQRIAFAALAATVGVVCIFAPVMFMQGATGRVFLELGVTVSVAVLLSYLEAVTLAPARCAQMLHKKPAAVGSNTRFARFEDWFGRLLSACMNRPGLTYGITIALCTAGLGLFAALPDNNTAMADESMVRIALEGPVGFTITQTEVTAKPFEDVCRAHPAVDQSVFLYGGWGKPNALMALLMLKPTSQRQDTSADVYSAFYQALAKSPELRPTRYDGAAISFALRSQYPDTLAAQAERVVDRLRAHPAIANVVSSLTPGPPRLILEPNRQALADSGVPAEALTETVNDLFAGANVGSFYLDGRHADIRMRLMASARTDPNSLSAIMLRGRNDRLIPLSTLVHVRLGAEALAISRRDRLRAVDISVNVAPGASLDAARAAVQALVPSLGDRVQLRWEAQTRDQDESKEQLYLAMVGGVLLTYGVLAAQLNSVALPALVLTAIPMAAAGAGFALWITGLPLGTTAFMGLLLLFGLVKKNTILLVDGTVQLRQQGMGRRASALGAARARLRPILMTTCATAVAVLPAACALSPGGADRMGMAWVVLGGLVSSTLLSLVVVPTVLAWSRQAASEPR